MIQVEGLTKSYSLARRDGGLFQAIKALGRRNAETVRALEDLSFTIRDGEIVGYIGPNGAGKSTTIKILSGILTPDSGLCLVNGRVPWKERKSHAAEIGVVFGQRTQLWWDVPVIDSYALLAEIYRIEPKRYQKNLDELTEMMDLSELLRTPARQLSLGQRMRCEIAASLLHEPKVLFLDEPTIGLHPLDVKTLLQVFQTLIDKGATVIVIEHDLDVIRNGDYIIDMGPGGGEEGGRIVAAGTPRQIMKNPDSITGRYLA